jgi:Tfp pilus assembly protein PilV
VIERLRRGDSEAGLSLPEVLVALVILVTAIVAIVGAFGTGILTSDVNKKNMTADAAIRSYAEVLSSRWKPSCAVNDYSPAAVGYAPPSGIEVSVVSVEGWTGATSGNMWGACTEAEAAPPAPDRAGLKRVRIEAHTIDERGRVQLDVIVRRGNDQ